MAMKPYKKRGTQYKGQPYQGAMEAKNRARAERRRGNNELGRKFDRTSRFKMGEARTASQRKYGGEDIKMQRGGNPPR